MISGTIQTMDKRWQINSQWYDVEDKVKKFASVKGVKVGFDISAEIEQGEKYDKIVRIEEIKSPEFETANHKHEEPKQEANSQKLYYSNKESLDRDRFEFEKSKSDAINVSGLYNTAVEICKSTNKTYMSPEEMTKDVIWISNMLNINKENVGYLKSITEVKDK
jgi:hypothetical protein